MFEFIYRKKIRSHRFVVSLKFSGWVMLDRGNVECLIFFFFFFESNSTQELFRVT